MRKLSIADIKASDILSIEEKKMVVGGEMTVDGGQCNGVGAWKYAERVSYEDCWAAVQKYCRNGGYCTNPRGTGWL